MYKLRFKNVIEYKGGFVILNPDNEAEPELSGHELGYREFLTECLLWLDGNWADDVELIWLVQLSRQEEAVFGSLYPNGSASYPSEIALENGSPAVRAFVKTVKESGFDSEIRHPVGNGMGGYWLLLRQKPD